MIYKIIAAIQNLWAKHKLLVIVNAVLVLGFLFFVLPLLLPKPPLEVKNPNLRGADQTVSGVTVELTIKEPAVPASLKLHRMSENFKQDESVFLDIAGRLKIDTVLAPDLRINSAGESLSLDTTQHRLAYSKTPVDAQGNEVKKLNTTPLNLETAKKQTQDWLTTIGFTDIEANALGTRFYINEDAYEGMEETEPSKANVIRFTFSRKLDGMDLAFGGSSAQPAYVTVSNDGVIQADLPAFVATFTPDQEKELMPFTSVIENIKAGKYTFAETIAAVSQNENDTKPKKFQITSASLMYRVDITQRAAIPYWNFTGNITLQNGQIVPLEITSPAIVL
jgi:hypothetical protein